MRCCGRSSAGTGRAAPAGVAVGPGSTSSRPLPKRPPPRSIVAKAAPVPSVTLRFRPADGIAKPAGRCRGTSRRTRRWRPVPVFWITSAKVTRSPAWTPFRLASMGVAARPSELITRRSAISGDPGAVKLTGPTGRVNEAFGAFVATTPLVMPRTGSVMAIWTIWVDVIGWLLLVVSVACGLVRQQQLVRERLPAAVTLNRRSMTLAALSGLMYCGQAKLDAVRDAVRRQRGRQAGEGVERVARAELRRPRGRARRARRWGRTSSLCPRRRSAGGGNRRA